MNHDWFFSHIAELEDHTAIIFNDERYSYSKLGRCIEEFYLELINAVPVGSVVAIMSDYSFESIALVFALFKNRNILVPIASGTENGISEKIQESNVEIKISIENKKLEFSKIEKHLPDHNLVTDLRNKNRSGLILFSSGTSGKPKAMIHDFDNLIETYRDKKKNKKITILIFLMFDHVGGINSILNSVVMGLTMVIPQKRTPEEVCAQIEKHKINILPTSPTFLNLILISEMYKVRDLSSLRMITYGTEPMPESLLAKLKNVFPKVKFLQTFGTSETGITQSFSLSSSSTFFKIDDSNIEYKIVDRELWLKSKTQILGYLNSSMDRFTSDGWFKTGDLVEQTEGDYFKIVGRSQEVINVGGEKVLPTEVESLLFQIPEIEDCSVFAEANPITGQAVVAKVLFKNKLKPSEAKKLIVDFCEGKIEKYKIPARVILQSEAEYTDRFKKKRV